MKYVIGGILALIGAAIWAGSVYISPDIQYRAIYGFMKTIAHILGFVIVIWIGIKIHGSDGNVDYGNSRYSHEEKSKKEKFLEILKDFGTPLLYFIIIIGIQVYIWKGDFIEHKITSLSQTISDHIEFPGGGEVPRFYIGEKPSK